jgi:predicted MPP superfamily phosphohydrolase
MDKILIVGDVHGRTFWKKAKELINEVDKVVFLGDYLDPYPHEYILRKDALSNFHDILAFKKEYPDKVILLIGNHDYHYWPKYKEYYGCRRDEERFDQISELFMSNLDNFQLSYKIENYLFTHAGVLDYWLKVLNGEKKVRCTVTFKFDHPITIDNLNELLGNDVLNMVSEERGGRDVYGSCIWADIHEHFYDAPIPDIYQVFGHTMTYPTISEEYIGPNFAMLDSQHCYILSDGTFQKIAE